MGRFSRDLFLKIFGDIPTGLVRTVGCGPSQGGPGRSTQKSVLNRSGPYLGQFTVPGYPFIGQPFVQYRSEVVLIIDQKGLGGVDFNRNRSLVIYDHLNRE
jgi:hypothetical protein